MINWRDLDPYRVERAVKMLVCRHHPDARPIDGAGGDRGRDLRWDSPDGLIIFEVKSYSRRLESSQKSSIENSLMAAARHAPTEWILILPLDHSPSEEDWFDSLQGEYPGITLRWRGLTWLDSSLAAHEDLRRYIEGPSYELLRRAAEFRQEEDVVARGLPDIQARVNRLERQMNEANVHWRVDVATSPLGSSYTFSEQYAGASQDDPILFRPIVTFPGGEPSARRARDDFLLAMDYGCGVTVDSQYIDSVEVQASEETRKLLGEHPPGSVESITFGAAEDNTGLPRLLHLDLVVDDQVVTSVGVRASRRTKGLRGTCLYCSDESETLRLRMLIDYPGDGPPPGRFIFEFNDIADRWPHAMRPLVEFLLGLEPGARFHVRFGAELLGQGDIEDVCAEDVRETLEFVRDLHEVQRGCGAQFPIPAKLTYADLENVQMAAELLRTGTATWRRRIWASAVAPEYLRSQLELNASRTAESAMVVEVERFGFVMANHEIGLGAVRLTGRVELRNVEAVETALTQERPVVLEWACRDAEAWHIVRVEPDDVA